MRRKRPLSLFSSFPADDEANGALFDLLNPIYQSDTPEKNAVYRVEPYVICADIYSVEPGVREVIVDGRTLKNTFTIDLVNDQKEHQVVIVMG